MPLQVYYAPGGREPPLLLACDETKPSYQRLEELMLPIIARSAYHPPSHWTPPPPSYAATILCERGPGARVGAGAGARAGR